MAGRTLVTPPAVEPVTVAEAKLFARITTDSEDTLVNDLIVAARKWAEDWRDQSFVTQTWDYVLDAFPDYRSGFDGFTPAGLQPWMGTPGLLAESPILLPRYPLQSVTSVKYTPYSGGQLTLDPTTYIVDTSNIRTPRIVPAFGRLWPTDLLVSANGVVVRFIAGYADVAGNPTVPEQVTLALKQLVSYWFYNRDATGTVPGSIKEILTDVTGGFAYA